MMLEECHVGTGTAATGIRQLTRIIKWRRVEAEKIKCVTKEKGLKDGSSRG